MWKLILNVFVYKDCRVPELFCSHFLKRDEEKTNIQHKTKLIHVLG